MSTGAIVAIVVAGIAIVVLVVVLSSRSSSSSSGGFFGSSSSSSGWGDIFGRIAGGIGDIVDRTGGTGTTQQPNAARVADDVVDTEATAATA